MKTETKMILDYIAGVEKRSEKRHDKLEAKVDAGFETMGKDIKKIQSFRWKIIGGSVALFVVAEMLVRLL